MNDDHEDWLGPDPEDVGAERPRGLRFGEGQKRNTAGRPAGSSNRRTIIKRVASKRHKVKVEGRQHTKTTLELVLLMIRNRAARGEIDAYKLQERMSARFEEKEHVPRAVFIGGEEMTSEEWEAVYCAPDCPENVHQQRILNRFPYILAHRKRWLEYQVKTYGYSTESGANAE